MRDYTLKQEAVNLNYKAATFNTDFNGNCLINDCIKFDLFKL